MNELDPDLKRLLKWAREASASRPEEAPYGFSGRVLVSRKPVPETTLFQELQRSARSLSWASLVLIVCGALIWVEAQRASSPAAQISSVLSFVATNLPQ